MKTFPVAIFGDAPHQQFTKIWKSADCFIFCIWDPFWSSGLRRFDYGILMGWLLHNAGNIQWFPAAAKYRLNQITVHLANELKRYLLRAHRFTLTMIRTTAEVFIHHCDNHAMPSVR